MDSAGRFPQNPSIQLEEAACWLAILAAEIGSQSLAPLLASYGSVCALVEAALSDMPATFASPAYERLRSVELDNIHMLAADPMWKHRHLVPLTDSRYPLLLHEIRSAPSCLIVSGDVGSLRRVSVAVVGTRRPPVWAERLAWEAGQQLAARRLGVVSGLAFGIDAAAHRGALSAGGPTVAVLGCGHDRLYPAAHSSLAAGISRSGAVISEYLPDAVAESQRLAARNRLISGLARALIVIAAEPDSGSRHAVTFAHQQGRLILAVPGTAGCDALLARGLADPLEPPVDWDRLAASVARQ